MAKVEWKASSNLVSKSCLQFFIATEGYITPMLRQTLYHEIYTSTTRIVSYSIASYLHHIILHYLPILQTMNLLKATTNGQHNIMEHIRWHQR